MPHLCLIHAGGTLGMQPSPQGLRPAAGQLAALVQRVLPVEATLTVVEYAPLLDSAEATPADWARLAADLAARRTAFDGFVVVHGTDTLAFTAAALAFLLPHFGKPVVVTGAQVPLCLPASDGWGNLAHAFAAASQPDFVEVGVVFAGQLLRGVRSQKVDAQQLAAFASLGTPALATFGVVADWQRALWRPHAAAEPFVPRSLNPQCRVVLATLAPGATVDFIAAALAQQPLDALVLAAFGNGNAPHHPVLEAALAAQVDAGALVVVVSQVPRGVVLGGAYASSQGLLATGAIGAGGMTVAAAVAKTHVVASLPVSPAARQAAFLADWAGERG